MRFKTLTVLHELNLLLLPCLHRVVELLTCILSSDVLADLLCINPSTLRININLIELTDFKDKLSEVWSHFDD